MINGLCQWKFWINCILSLNADPWKMFDFFWQSCNMARVMAADNNRDSLQEIYKDLRERIDLLLKEIRETLDIDDAYILSLDQDDRPNKEIAKALSMIGSLRKVNLKERMPESFGKLIEGIPVVGNIESFSPEEQKVLRECEVSFLGFMPLTKRESGYTECLVCTSRRKRDWGMEGLSLFMEYGIKVKRLIGQLKTIAQVERDQFLLDNTNDIILAYDNEGIVTYVSSAFERLTPFHASDLVGHSMFEFLRPEDHAKARERLRLLQLGVSMPHEYRIGERWYRFNCHPIIENGRLKETVSIMSDITELKETEHTIRESEEKYRVLAENIRDMVSVWNMDLKPVYINPAVQELLGYTPKDVIETFQDISPLEILAPRSAKVLMDVIDKRMSTDPGPGVPERQDPVELELVRKDGTTVWTETRFSFLRNELGERTGIVAVTRNIDKRLRVFTDPDFILEQARMFLYGNRFMIWTTGMDLIFTYVSPSVKNILEYSQKEYMGMEAGKTMDAVSLTRLSSAFEEGLLYARKKTVDWHTIVEAKYRTKTKRSRKAKIILSLIREGYGGKASGFLGISCFHL
ncbi:MAG: hypothetical protein DRG37_07850 [Deltaproteobacteria bacterium]|nr:MAG: hypothetical protein DRG37_07850 [Deltaproteobacteria bacterium]